MFEYKPRIVDTQLKRKLKSIGAVLIEGPKWCGKTTTGMQFANSNIRLDNPAEKDLYLQMVSLDPQSLLMGNTPRLVDEWQLAPKLWDAARYEVDSRMQPGQFIFTGSAVPVDSDEIFHSGAGRFSWLTMRPMSLYESGDSTGSVRLKDLFSNPKMIEGINEASLNDISYLICRGGWPQTLNLEPEDALTLAFDYYEAIIKSDINRADGVSKNPERVKKLLTSYARNICSQAANTAIKKDIMINDTYSINEYTVLSYINALKKIFVVEEMPAWNPNLRSKAAIRTSDTRYFVDPSIAAASLGIGPKDLSSDLNTLALMFENLCVRDLRVYADALNGSVYHYRDSKDLECDCVIHLKNGEYGLIEIKLGGDLLIEKGVKNLKKLSSNIDLTKMNKPSFLMILTGVGTYAYKREDGIFIVPIKCLKD